MLFYSHGSLNFLFKHLHLLDNCIFFLNSPYPSLKLKNTFGSCALFTKQKEEKKAKKNIVKGEKKQLNIFWINIWYFF